MSFITWSDHTASYNNDFIYCKDKCIINKSASFQNIAGTGYTGVGFCGWIGQCMTSSTDPYDWTMLQWENPPAQSHTIVLDGMMVCSAGAVIEIGTSGSRIPYEQRAIIQTKSTPTIGTAGYSGFGSTFLRQYYGDAGAGLRMWGEVSGSLSCKLIETGVVGNNYVYVDDPSGFAVGEVVRISKSNTKGLGQYTTNLTINNIADVTMSFSTTLATNDRLVGARVTKISPLTGIFIENSSTTVSVFRFGAPCVWETVGIHNYYTQWINSYFSAYAWTGPIKPHLVDNVTYWGVSTSGLFSVAGIPSSGLTISNCVSLVGGIIGNGYAFLDKRTGQLYKSGKLIIRNCATSNGGFLLTAPTRPYVLEITDCDLHNSARAGVALSGYDLIFKNNDIHACYGSVDSEYAAILMSGVLNVADVSGNEYNNNNALFYPSTLYNNTGFVSVNDSFANLASNTYDIYLNAGVVENFIFDTPNVSGSLVIAGADQTELAPGSSIAIVNESFAKDDRVLEPNGNIKRCGSGLTDSTVHISGSNNYSFRMESLSSTDYFEWTQIIPTGDIQNKDMTIVAWCKINSSSYWSGSHSMPRLYVEYDNHYSSSYTEATQTTDWQLLSTTFTPTTTAGRIEVSLQTKTNVTGSNAYVYWDDVSVLYPVGTQINLGGLDIWADGYPITPTIATSVNANDVWAVDPTTFGVGSVGEHVYKKTLTTSKFLGLK